MKRYSISLIMSFFFILTSLFAQHSAPKSNSKEPEHEVLITTSLGDIKIKLYNETPKHRDNFLKLVKEGYYEDLLFHRVINTFMIQGGDPDSRGAKPGKQLGEGGPEYSIPAEIVDGIYHKRGALAAARESDDVNPKRESSGSQFYIVQGKVYPDLTFVEKRYNTKLNDEQKKIYSGVGGTPQLDGKYTVFGEVLEGMDVVDKIASVKTTKDRPDVDIKMKMKIIK